MREDPTNERPLALIVSIGAAFASPIVYTLTLKVVTHFFPWINSVSLRDRIVQIHENPVDFKRSHYYHTPPDPDALSTGLYTSCRLIVDMLTDHGFQASLVIVTDNNDIDRVVNRIKPDVVIIEALWVVPSKFKILKQLYPKVIWVVRIHSDFPFLAHEGMAMGWIYDYFRLGVMVAANSEHVTQVLGSMVYLPNYYPVPKHVPEFASAAR